MTMRSPNGGFISAGYDPLRTPNAPTIGTATSASGTSISVAFTAPANIGGSAITSYTVFSSGGQTATGSASPVIVTGLTTGTAYTFTVLATNSYGSSPVSASSNSATPVAQGQQAYTTAGTYSWTAPAGITSVSVVAVGGGSGGGGGGALAYKNNITVVPGSSYTVVVGARGVSGGAGATGTNGGDSSFTAGFGTMTAGGGKNATGGGCPGGTPSGTYDGGGSGGAGINGIGANGYSGGGAGGYSGNGGNGGYPGTGFPGAGGGGAGGDFPYNAGGGVGILGQGTSGATGGQGGSGGTAGSNGPGGTYGGGSSGDPSGSLGGVGAVRIIYPGTTRAFPSTNTGDL